MCKNFAPKLFNLIPIFLILNLFFRWDLTRTTSPDSYNYFDFATSLPKIHDSIFPVLYPITLKIVNFFCANYQVSYKIIALVSLIFSLTFVRIKKFYWKEFWTLLTFYSFLRIMSWAWSEVIIFPLFLLIFYTNFQFLHNKKVAKDFVIENSILLILILLTKYSSVFIILAFLLFSIYLYLRKISSASSYFISSCIAIVATLLYFSINHYFTGYIMGKRISPNGEYFNIRLSFSQVLFNLNPFFHTRVEKYLGLFSINWFFSYLVSFFSMAIWVYLIFKAIKNGKISEGTSLVMLLNIFISFVFLMGTVFSYFTTKIDILDFRLLLGFYTFFFFSVISVLPNLGKKDCILISVALFCCASNIINLFS